MLPLTSKEAQQQAQAEGLTLLVAKNKVGYYGVVLEPRSKSKPYRVQVWSGGKMVNLGSFATAEEAALCVARSPEGRAAAEQAASPSSTAGNEQRGGRHGPRQERGRGPSSYAVTRSLVRRSRQGGKTLDSTSMPPAATLKQVFLGDNDSCSESEGDRPKKRPKKSLNQCESAAWAGHEAHL